MVVNEQTKWLAFQPFERYLQKGEVERLKAVAPQAVFGRDGYLSLTIADFNQIAMHGDLTGVLGNRSELELTVFEWYAISGLKEFFEQFAKDLEKFIVKADAKEERAAAACYKTGVVEGMLIFAREYFELHSFAEAERVTLADLLLAKKDTYNRAMFERAYQAQFKRDKRK